MADRLLCFFGIHRRIRIDDGSPFVSRTFACRCGIWHWVNLGMHSGWVRADG